MPVDPPRSRCSGTLVNSRNQCSPNPYAARVLRREQVLQIAGRLDHRRTSMKEVMDGPDQNGRRFGDQAVDRLMVVEKPRPCGPRYVHRQCCGPDTLVEGVIAVP